MQETAHPQVKSKTVAEVFEEERESLSAFYPYTGCRTEAVRVSPLSLVRIDGNKYSVPLSFDRPYRTPANHGRSGQNDDR